MKRIVAMMLVVLMIGMIVVSCGADNTKEEKVVTETTTKSKPAPKPTPKPKKTTNTYSDAIMTCQLPAIWEGNHYGFNDLMECGGGYSTELIFDTRTNEFREISVDIHYLKDYMQPYSTINSAIVASYNCWSNSRTAFIDDGCKLKSITLGSNKYREWYNSPDTTYRIYYIIVGDNLCCVHVRIEYLKYESELNEILSRITFKDM